MADPGNFIGNLGSSVGEGAAGFLHTLGIIAPYLGVVILMGLGFWYFIHQRSFNREILLYKLSGPGFKKISDRAKVWKDKHGVGFWRTKKTKLLLDIPPSECVLPGDSGDFAVCYVNSIGEVIWCRPGYQPELVHKKIKLINDYNRLLEDYNKRKLQYKKDNKPFEETPPILTAEGQMDAFEQEVSKFLKDFRPVNTNQRASYAYQEDMAKKELKLDFLKQNFPIILGGIFIIVFILVLGIMWGKFMAPLNERANANEGYNLEMDKNHLEELKILNDIYGKVQTLSSSFGGNTSKPAPPSINLVS